MSEGQKRLEPRMTRGGFRFQLFIWILLAVNPISQLVARSDEPWDGFHFLMVALLVLCAAGLTYLFHVRHIATDISGMKKKLGGRTGIVGAGSFSQDTKDPKAKPDRHDTSLQAVSGRIEQSVEAGPGPDRLSAAASPRQSQRQYCP